VQPMLGRRSNEIVRTPQWHLLNDLNECLGQEAGRYQPRGHEGCFLYVQDITTIPVTLRKRLALTHFESPRVPRRVPCVSHATMA
jgi:hypothetical protein